jgi:DnaJ-class molecular chaperone
MSGICAVCDGKKKCKGCNGTGFKDGKMCVYCDGDKRCPRCHGKGIDPA